MHLVLFQPDQAANTGTMLRMAACFGVKVIIIEPCGFIMSDSKLKRAGLDYLSRVDVKRYMNWDTYMADYSKSRKILLTTKGATLYSTLRYDADDHFIVGQESCGAPEYVHDTAAARVRIPMREGERSFNVAMSAAIVMSHALNQQGFPQCR